MIQRLSNISKSQSFFLFGPRGTGKSTLLKTLFTPKEALWINLLDQRQEFELNSDPDSLLEKWSVDKPKWIIIDEIQKIPRLLDVVHRGIEDHKIKFALTGSSARKLKRGGANLLAGRAASYSLSPFSALELESEFDLATALETGLLPRLWNELDNKEDRVRALYSYVQTYLKEEIAAEQLVRNLDPFRRVLIAAAQSNSKIINFAAIERDAGVAHSQAERHFEILVDTMVGRYLEPHENSLRKRQTKKSKFYFFDTGVLRTLTNLVSESLPLSTYEYGQIFETFLVNEFFKLNEALEKRWQLSFFRTKNDLEIDLIIEKPRGKPIIVEIKSWNQFPPTEKMNTFHNLAGEFIGSDKYVLSNTKESKIVDDVQYLHWRKGLEQIFNLGS